jgi:hypothetical protein
MADTDKDANDRKRSPAEVEQQQRKEQSHTAVHATKPPLKSPEQIRKEIEDADRFQSTDN